MNRKEYYAITKAWEEKYGVKSRAFHYDPREVKLVCEKCKHHKIGGMARHHKANDFFFALWLPDVYAARYLEFNREDCAKLCQYCHKKVELYYTRLKIELYEDFALFNKIVDKTWCEQWRSRFLAKYQEWLSKPIKRRKKSRSTSKRKDDNRNQRSYRHRSS